MKYDPTNNVLRVLLFLGATVLMAFSVRCLGWAIEYISGMLFLISIGGVGLAANAMLVAYRPEKYKWWDWL